MKEELDKALSELRENVDHFRKMIDSFQQTDQRLDDMESKLTTIRQSLGETKGQQVDRPAIDEIFYRLNQEQQAIKKALARLSEDVQSIKPEHRSGQHQEVIETNLARLEKGQQVTKGILTQLEREQQAMKEVLSSFDGNFSQTFIKQRRWIVVLSALLAITVLAVAALTFQYNNLPAAISVVSGKNPNKLNTEAEKHSMDSVAPVNNLPQATSNSSSQINSASDPIPLPAESRPANLMSSETAEKVIKDRSGFALTYLKHANFERLAAKYIHPEKGVRFFPIGLTSGKSFSVRAISNVMNDTEKYDWGVKHAAGEPSIEAPFGDYYKRYIYDQDFLTATQVRFNDITLPGKYGLSSAKIAERFPGCIFVEYLKNGRSLVLVFERFDGPGVWYLVGVVHGE